MADVRDVDGEQNAGLYSTSANVHTNVEPDGFEILLAPPTKQAANTTQRYSISTGRLGIDLSAVRPLTLYPLGNSPASVRVFRNTTCMPTSSCK